MGPYSGGFAIGWWNAQTLRKATGKKTAFAPVGLVPHIDPWALAISAEHEAPPPPVSLKANPIQAWWPFPRGSGWRATTELQLRIARLSTRATPSVGLSRRPQLPYCR